MLVVAVMAAMAVGAWDFSGIVYCDRNGNGVQDKGEKGIKGIAVTNGDTIVLTDRKGRYVLPHSGCRLHDGGTPGGQCQLCLHGWTEGREQG